jgi:ribosomal protein S12 methylthiotransferase accessory factor
VAQLAGDFNSGSNYVASGLPKPLTMAEVPYITNPGMTITINDMVDLSDANMKVEIENCIAALKRLDLDVFVVDVAHPGLKIPAIYTIVPGCHFRERSRISNAGLFAAKLVSEHILDPESCARQLLAMQEILPDAYFLEFYLAKNMIALDLLDEAAAHLERALTLNPEEEDTPYIYSYLGDTLKTLGRYEEAIAAIEKGRDYDDERPDFHNILGVCYFKLERYNDAIERFHRAVHLHPSSAIDYANLGVNYRKIGNTEEAAKFFKLALSLDSTIAFAAAQLAEIQAEPA